MWVSVSQDDCSVPSLCIPDAQEGVINGKLDSPLCRGYPLTRARDGEVLSWIAGRSHLPTEKIVLCPQ